MRTAWRIAPPGDETIPGSPRSEREASQAGSGRRHRLSSSSLEPTTTRHHPVTPEGTTDHV